MRSTIGCVPWGVKAISKAAKLLIGMVLLAVPIASAAESDVLGLTQVDKDDANFPGHGNVLTSKHSDLHNFTSETIALYDMVEHSLEDGKADLIMNRFYASNTISLGPDRKPQFGRDTLAKSYDGLVSEYNVQLVSKHSFVRGVIGCDRVNFNLIPKKPKSEAQSINFVTLCL